jgi:hypothetical protein
MSDPPIFARKMVGYLPLSEGMADDYPGFADHIRGVLDGSITVPSPLPDPGLNPIWTTLVVAAQAEPVLLDLLQLHKAHAECHPASIDWVCHGEPPSGYEWEYAGWPCETVGIIADHLGVDLANDPDHD